ncbi:glutaredoxin family protein [Priestia megaterium]|uniref:glutaredoxin family protein n=1 Tax=Priestia megaterium TaxID=1404 RepID=UPI00390C92ED
MSVKILLWNRKGCYHCEELKAYFHEKGHQYESIDVEGKDYLRDLLEIKYGIRHVPVVEIGDKGQFKGVIEKDYEQIEKLIEDYSPIVK